MRIFESGFFGQNTTSGSRIEHNSEKMNFKNFKLMKTKVLIHTSMIVVRVGRLRVRLAYVHICVIHV